MSIQVDIWLRGENHATTREIELPNDVGRWTDDDVREMLEGMLRAMDRQKHPDKYGVEDPPPVTLRGLSWIVNPFEEGGVVLAIEVGLGAAIAGPFAIDQKALEAMVTRVLSRPPVPGSSSIH